MKKNWIDPNFILGSVAIDSDFYIRNDIVTDIWSKLKKGNSVLLNVHRRVGKTSILLYMKQNPIENYQLIFQNIQGINSADEFFERIYSLLLICLSKMSKSKKWFKKFLCQKKITQISPVNIEFKTKPVNFIEEIASLLIEINNIEEVENIVLLLDEFPEALVNIINKSKIDASTILINLKKWRKQPEMNKKLKYVLAGSVNIRYVTDKIKKRNSDLNDIKKVELKPLSENEAYDYIGWATQNATVIYTPELKKYLLSKIQYFVPYYFNLLIDKINEQSKKVNNPSITTKNIDAAFDTIIKHSDNFKDSKKRVQDYLPAEKFKFANEILIQIAHKGQNNLQEIFDKAVKYNQIDDYMKIIDYLERDGYLTVIEGKYRFISPFLSELWKRNNPIYNA